MKQICRICKNDKDIDEYNRRNDNKIGYRTECKECQSINLKENYNKNKKYRLEKQKIYYNNNHHIKKYRDYSRLDLNKFNTTLDFTKDELKNILNDKCYYCGDDKSKMGLDRIDNNKGHTLDNVVVCCELCNMTRGDRYSVEEMLLLGEVIKKIKYTRI